MKIHRFLLAVVLMTAGACGGTAGTGTGSEAPQQTAASPAPVEPAKASVEAPPAPKDGTEWSVHLTTDKLTDVDAWVAVGTVRESDVMYQFTLTCADQARKVTLGAFDSNSQPRRLMFKPKALNPGGSEPAVETVVEFKFRIDNDQPHSALLQHQYANVGTWLGTGEPQDMGEAMAMTMLRLQDFVGFNQLPSRRLVIADVFPDETVEVDFSSMTPDDHDLVRDACFRRKTQASDTPTDDAPTPVTPQSEPVR